jgi:hypothetical protein
MPAAIVQRAGELLDQAAAHFLSGARIDPLALGGDALLQHRADHFPVVSGPKVCAGVEQAFARCFEADRSAFFFRQRLPQQTIVPRWRSGDGAILVDRIALSFGGLQQALHSEAISACRWFSSTARSFAVSNSLRWAISSARRAAKAIRRFGSVLVETRGR